MFDNIDIPTSENNAVEAIINIVKKYPKEINLICCGPLTNIALAMELEPSLENNLSEIYIMGGTYYGKYNLF